MSIIFYHNSFCLCLLFPQTPLITDCLSNTTIGQQAADKVLMAVLTHSLISIAPAARHALHDKSQTQCHAQ